MELFIIYYLLISITTRQHCHKYTECPSDHVQLARQWFYRIQFLRYFVPEEIGFINFFEKIGYRNLRKTRELGWFLTEYEQTPSKMLFRVTEQNKFFKKWDLSNKFFRPTLFPRKWSFYTFARYFYRLVFDEFSKSILSKKASKLYSRFSTFFSKNTQQYSDYPWWSIMRF